MLVKKVPFIRKISRTKPGKKQLFSQPFFGGFCDRGHHLALNFCHDPAHLIIKPALCLCFHGIWWSTYMSTYSYMIPPRIPITTRDSNHHQDKLAFLTPEISTKKPSFWGPLVRSCFLRVQVCSLGKETLKISSGKWRDNLSKYAVRGGVPAIQPALPAPRRSPMLRGPWRLGRCIISLMFPGFSGEWNMETVPAFFDVYVFF